MNPGANNRATGADTRIIVVLESLRPVKPLRAVGLSLCVVALGMFILLTAAALDVAFVVNRPWNTACILFNDAGPPPAGEFFPVRARPVQRDTALESDLSNQALSLIVGWERFDEELQLTSQETLIGIEGVPHVLPLLLAEGRLPEPGHAEVLAGAIARDDAFRIDDVQFTVVGRLHPFVSGFLFSYLLPDAEQFGALLTEERGAASGVLVVDCLELLQAGIPDPFASPPDIVISDMGQTAALQARFDRGYSPPPISGGILSARSLVAWIGTAGLFVVVLGGALFHFYLFMALRLSRWCPFRSLFNEMFERPLLYLAIHMLLYGAFFFSIVNAINNPLLGYRIAQYISAMFKAQDALGYVGAAYDSGRVGYAAWATFYNNYIIQTLLLTFAVSVAPIPLGVLKTVASFLVVGGAMAPMWSGAAQGLVLHSITVALELQAYVVACFAISAWPLILIWGVLRGPFPPALWQGLKVFVGAVALTAIMLALVAFYEAYTLIHLI